MNKRSLSRLLAVQYIYQFCFNNLINAEQFIIDIKNNAPNKNLLIDINDKRAKKIENFNITEDSIDKDLIILILNGIKDNQEEINNQIDLRLSNKWSRDTMGFLVYSILLCGFFELIFHDIEKKIICCDYTDIASIFFDQDCEIAMINAVLDKQANNNV